LKALLLNKNFWIIIFAGLAARLVALGIDAVHPTDYTLFWSWARVMDEHGFSAYYPVASHSDYMPGYLYILRLKAFIEGVFWDIIPVTHAYGNVVTTYMHRFVFMLPSILADVATGALIYVWARNGIKTEPLHERIKLENRALMLGLLYALNPASIIISAVWGQVEAVYVLIVLLSLYMLTKKRFLPAFMLYTFGILVKPQSIVFGPLFLYFLFEYLRERQFSVKSFLVVARNGAVCVAMLVIIILPFGTFYRDVDIADVVQLASPQGHYVRFEESGNVLRIAGNRQGRNNFNPTDIVWTIDANGYLTARIPHGTGVAVVSEMPAFILQEGYIEDNTTQSSYSDGWTLMPVFNQFFDTIGQRPFATVNAYNFWAALGLNWYPIDGGGDWYGERLFSPPGMLIRVIGYAVGVGGAALAGLWVLIKTKNYFFAGAVTNAMFFMFSERIHDRYGFAVMLLLLAAIAVSKRVGTGEDAGIKVASARKERWKNKQAFYAFGWRMLLVYGGVTLAFFLNYYIVLRNTIAGPPYMWSVSDAMFYSWFFIVPFGYLVYLTVKITFGKNNAITENKAKVKTENEES